MTYHQNWDMDSIFAGGSASPELRERLDGLQTRVKEYKDRVTAWNPSEDKPAYNTYASLLKEQEEILFSLGEARTFAGGLLSANVEDKKAGQVVSEIGTLGSELSTVNTILTKKIVSMSDEDWNGLLTQDAFKEIAFPLNEQRDQGKELLSEEEEALLNALSNDGFGGWGTHYNSIVSSISIEVEEDGETIELSAGQAQNRMESHPSTEERHKVLEKWEEAWSSKSALFADTLNHLAGFRLTNYKFHGVEDFMERPLEYNRMKQETLDAMWDTISENKDAVVKYMNRKAQLLGLDKLAWSDVEAPLLVNGYESRSFSYDDAAAFIMKHFETFSPRMKDLAQTAFEDRWIEAEDRPGKRPGGYCANLPESGESRIFMTFSNAPNEVATLAHELGHAFHSHVMRDLPALNRRYAMNVAETASTFAELIVSDATVKEAEGKAEKINLLDDQISRAATMFMNIHSRYLFEKNFYEERKNGVVTDEKLNELMLDAQKEAYKDSLSTYHPSFWSSKLHFYNTGGPFYNFPYTFGYLFRLGIYARSLEEGEGFEQKYIDLLRDTASMTTEELAEKHLDADLTKPDFWQAGIDLIKKDIDTFMELTEEYVK